MNILTIAGPPPAGGVELQDWLVLFWEYHAGLQTAAGERARCEDQAWRHCRLAAALRRDAARQEAR